MSNSSSTATPASGQELAYSGEITVVFRNNKYQFVILREFALPAGAPRSTWSWLRVRWARRSPRLATPHCGAPDTAHGGGGSKATGERASHRDV